MNNTVLPVDIYNVLCGVLQLLQSEENWKQLTCASSAHTDYITRIDDPTATAWCVDGVVTKIADTHTTREKRKVLAYEVMMYIQKFLPDEYRNTNTPDDVREYNDAPGREFSEIRHLLERVCSAAAEPLPKTYDYRVLETA